MTPPFDILALTHGGPLTNLKVFFVWLIRLNQLVDLALVGDILWLVAYAAAVWKGFKQRTYCIPFVAVCLNVTWEAINVVMGLQDTNGHLREIVQDGWLVLDVVILGQLAWYGKEQQVIPMIQQVFYQLLAAALVMALLGQHGFMEYFPIDVSKGAVGEAFLINLVMSILFVFFILLRPDMRGISLVVGWTKMLGTVLVGIGNMLRIIEQGMNPFAPGQVFLAYLIGFIFVFDVWYVMLIYQSRKRQFRHDMAVASAVA